MRIVLLYEAFGPYHVARLRCSRPVFESAGYDLLALELLSGTDTYRWEHDSQSSLPITRLNARSDGRDQVSWRDVPHLFRSLRQFRPDVVFVNGWGTRTALLIHGWCARNGVARIVISDSQFHDRRRVLLVERFKSHLLSGCRSAFVAGAPQRRYLQRLGFPPNNIVEGCDVVDNDHFARAQQLRKTGGYRLLTVARWVTQKNLVNAAQAFLAFVSDGPATEPWQWNLVGYGPEQERLRELAATSEDRIRLLGFRSYDQLPEVYAEAALYWQPSLMEPWGLVVNEAMAAGLPVLVSERCGCAEDLVHPEVGWTFDATTQDSMRQALKLAASQKDAWPAMGEAAAQQIARWDLDRFAQGALTAVRIALDNQVPAKQNG